MNSPMSRSGGRAGAVRPPDHLSVAPADGASEREADASAALGGRVSPMPFPVVHRKLSRKGRVTSGEDEIEMDTSSNGPALRSRGDQLHPRQDESADRRDSVHPRSPSRRRRQRCGRSCTRSRRTSRITRHRRIQRRASRVATTWISTRWARSRACPWSRRTTRT